MNPQRWTWGLLLAALGAVLAHRPAPPLQPPFVPARPTYFFLQFHLSPASPCSVLT
ncbi:hypothetical protein [Hymenobacter negativus]|uniref:Uncharacterized protein n=1 Tax=Hymenobacter negativus TaxID=2795026 RepID=A0ABS3QBG3_9BACT|nr:hypothetical protein [Hymenobacter negativus]MBO2008591.1 hypothetical protein [Hymenobacter negativus]